MGPIGYLQHNCFSRDSNYFESWEKRNYCNKTLHVILLFISIFGIMLIAGFLSLLIGSIINGDLFNKSICDDCSFGSLLTKGYIYFIFYILSLIVTLLSFGPIITPIIVLTITFCDENYKCKIIMFVSMVMAVISIYWTFILGLISLNNDECNIKTYGGLINSICLMGGLYIGGYLLGIYMVVISIILIGQQIWLFLIRVKSDYIQYSNLIAPLKSDRAIIYYDTINIKLPEKV